MKFRVQVAHKDNITKPWWEYYDQKTIIANELRSSKSSSRHCTQAQKPFWKNEPEQWGKKMVEWFNLTLRPTEKIRVFLKVEVIKGEPGK